MVGRNCIELDPGGMAWDFTGARVWRVHETSEFALEGHVLSIIRWVVWLCLERSLRDAWVSILARARSFWPGSSGCPGACGDDGW
eukprot:4498604-Alexandrium_andersonii.AAC.1